MTFKISIHEENRVTCTMVTEDELDVIVVSAVAFAFTSLILVKKRRASLD